MAATDEKNNTGPEIGLFETWVKKNYGGNSRTKTITSEKYLRICKLIRGEDPNSNAKFRFWVRNKGFRLLRHDKNTDEILDDPCGSLFVSLHAKEGSTPMGERSIEKFLRTNLPAISFFRKVAIVEEFYGIIKCAHVDEKGVHAGQKKTYRLVSDTYAFLPREVITFYLLNCNTCKPRIQKYGPIPSKARMNNLGPRKMQPERNPIPTQNEQEAQNKKEEAANPHQVIRPSPKRYRPTFIDNVLPDGYAPPKMYPSQHNSPNMSDTPTVHILDPRPETNHPPPYIVPQMKKHPDHPIVRGVPSPIRRTEDVFKSNYYNYPPYTISSSVNGMKELRGYRDYPNDNMHGAIETPENRKRKLESDNKASSFSEVISSSNSYRSHYNSIFNSVEIEKYAPRHIHGCRMQPYKLLHRNDVMHNYRRHVIESSYEKELPPYPYHTHPAYLTPAKREDKNIYIEEKKYPKTEIPSPSAWHKKLSVEIIENETGSWYSMPKHAREKFPLDSSNIVNNMLMEEIREKYAFDRNVRDSRKLLTYRKENELYAVNQYHKLVCDTVNSSLSSLCQPTAARNEGRPPNLKVPDQSKIMKVLQETNAEELCDSGSDSSEV